MKFDEFVNSDGTMGYDPTSQGANYILDIAKKDPMLKPYIVETEGGDTGNSNSDKCLTGYRRTASEFFVYLAQKKGVRRKEFSACSWPKRSLSVVKTLTHPLSFLFRRPILGRYEGRRQVAPSKLCS